MTSSYWICWRKTKARKNGLDEQKCNRPVYQGLRHRLQLNLSSAFLCEVKNLQHRSATFTSLRMIPWTHCTESWLQFMNCYENNMHAKQTKWSWDAQKESDVGQIAFIEHLSKWIIRTTVSHDWNAIIERRTHKNLRRDNSLTSTANFLETGQTFFFKVISRRSFVQKTKIPKNK